MIDEDVHGDVTVDAIDLTEELTGSAGAAADAVAGAFALRLGDDSLILAQQLGEWISRAPELEEDVALGNIALDLLGHARSLLHYAGTADGRSEDDLAYWRDESEFTCAWIFQQPNGDFAHTIARQLFVSVYLFELYDSLRESSDATLAAVAAKAVKEVEYHRDHAVQWTLRLAGGTTESRQRMIRGLNDLWPYVDELFVDDELSATLAARSIAVLPFTLRPAFDAVIAAVLTEADLDALNAKPSSAGGRTGNHTARLGFILAEMQVLARQHPGATW